MVIKQIDARLLQKLFLAGAKAIEAKKELINDLNVFPVPDGDTGTNMTLTIMSAAKEVAAITEPTIVTLCDAISRGSLRGARGNSGVILSQLFRGFTKEVREYETIDITTTANAFTRAVNTAYKAVMKPKEGTILTVARGGAELAAEMVADTDDFIIFGARLLKHMEDVLAYTPELLPVLKEAGVVDSGGQGLLEIMKGIYDCLLGKELDFTIAAPTANAPGRANTENISTADIRFGYCTEFIIKVEKHYDEDEEIKFKAYLESLGDSIVLVSDEDVVKVHVHTNDPGLAIQKALTYGSLSRMKIDNMREEHNERLGLSGKTAETAPAEATKKAAEPKKPVGFIAVSVGNGINEILQGLGVDYIIEGGQTMNPSTEDMLNAISAVNADTIYILPNNSNIILAAQQAKQLTKDKDIVVIPTKNVPQGISALINFVFDKSAEENEARMIQEMSKVRTGQVTYAVRDTNMDGKEIKQNDIMGLDGKHILSVGNDIDEVTVETAISLIGDADELVSLYYGENITQEQAQKVADMICEMCPHIDVEIHMGGQPIYYYILSVE